MYVQRLYDIRVLYAIGNLDLVSYVHNRRTWRCNVIYYVFLFEIHKEDEIVLNTAQLWQEIIDQKEIRHKKVEEEPTQRELTLLAGLYDITLVSRDPN